MRSDFGLVNGRLSAAADGVRRDPSRWPEPDLHLDIMVMRLMEATMGRGILLWLLGVPIPIIILLALFAR